VKKDDSRFMVIVLVQKWVAMSLHKLGSGVELLSIWEFYGVHKSTFLKHNKGVL
jgi:hypothetical protein